MSSPPRANGPAKSGEQPLSFELLENGLHFISAALEYARAHQVDN
jgi:hypothetical protein